MAQMNRRNKTRRNRNKTEGGKRKDKRNKTEGGKRRKAHARRTRKNRKH